MSTEDVDLNRRHFLTVATTVVGGVGAVMAAVPFVSSMQPSARAKAMGAPVDIDISKLQPGAMLKVKWRGKPVWAVQRPQAALDRLPGLDDRLRDPKSQEPQQPPYCQNESRAIKSHVFIVVGICTHLGCSPSYRPEVAPEDLGPEWEGGFFCPCHGSRYDLAGRVYKGVPAPLNLQVPSHRYVTDTVIRIGEDPRKA